MLKDLFKGIIKTLGYKPRTIVEGINKWSLKLAWREQGLADMIEKLRLIVPDISHQYSQPSALTDYDKIKARSQQAFQCTLMLKALEALPGQELTVADIGDSAGTHMLYLRELVQDREQVKTISVNLDPRAIDKIRKRGLRAILCRAEEVDFYGEKVDLFTSFEMVEHLHNPAIFFRRLAKKTTCNNMLITVPYVRTSRVGLHEIRREVRENYYAEDAHIFELNPQDWSLLLRHSGWRVAHSEIYYQYPRKWPGLAQLMALYWRATDFEGFWGAILEKDTSLSDYYQDWED